MSTRLKLMTLATALSLAGGLAHADDRGDLETLKQTTINLIQILVQQGVLTQDKADALVQQAEVKAQATVAAQKAQAAAMPAATVTDAAASAAAAAPRAGEVRVRYLPESVKKEITDSVREEVVAQAKIERWGDVNAVPEWVDRLKWSGDIRVGYENDNFGSANAPEVYFQTQGDTSVKNTLVTQEMMRLRARLALDATVSPETSAGFRLTTGNSADPTSTSQTLGQYDEKYSFTLDRAFLKYQPQSDTPWLTLTGGRMPNPFFSTNLVWNDNLNFEGMAATADPYSSLGTAVWRPYATLGAFAIQYAQPSQSSLATSKWLLGSQVGVEWVPSVDKRAKVGLAFYSYKNMVGVPNSSASPDLYDGTVPAFIQRGNTRFNIDNGVVNSSGTALSPLFGLASDYQEMDLTGTLDVNLSNPVHLMLTGDYVQNLGFNAAQVQALTGTAVTPETVGYLARAAVGMPSMLLRGDWQLSVEYRYLQKDAVLDAFTDSDFALGGTNNQGYVLGAQYATSRNTWLSARYMASTEISGLPYAVNVLQLYLNAKF